MQKDSIVKRVVVDTNLWISFLIGHRLGALLDIFQRIDFEFVTTKILRDEIHNVAIRPKFRRYFSEESVVALNFWLNIHTTNVELEDILQDVAIQKTIISWNLLFNQGQFI